MGIKLPKFVQDGIYPFMKVKVILTLFLLSECTFCIAQQNTNTLSPSSSHVVNKIDHPFISNNLEYLEYLYDKKEKANVK